MYVLDYKTARVGAGDKVYVRDYRRVNHKEWVEAIILSYESEKVYQCKVEQNLVWRRHIDQIKRREVEQTDILGTPVLKEPTVEDLPLVTANNHEINGNRKEASSEYRGPTPNEGELPITERPDALQEAGGNKASQTPVAPAFPSSRRTSQDPITTNRKEEGPKEPEPVSGTIEQTKSVGSVRPRGNVKPPDRYGFPTRVEECDVSAAQPNGGVRKMCNARKAK